MAMSAYLVSKAALVDQRRGARARRDRRPGARDRPGGVPLPRAVRDPRRDAPDPRGPPRLALRVDRAARARPASRRARAGDVLARLVADVDTLEDFSVRVALPPIVAVLTTLFASLLLGAFDAGCGRCCSRSSC